MVLYVRTSGIVLRLPAVPLNLQLAAEFNNKDFNTRSTNHWTHSPTSSIVHATRLTTLSQPGLASFSTCLSSLAVSPLATNKYCAKVAGEEPFTVAFKNKILDQIGAG